MTATPTTAKPTASDTATLDPGASDTGTVEGTVVDESQLPVAGVVAGLDNKANATTGEDGFFRIEKVPAGSHTIYFQKIGYAAAARRVDVPAGDLVQVRVTLTAIAVDASYHETLKQTGIVFCGVATRTSSSQNHTSAKGNICVLFAQGGQESFDKSQIRWFLKLFNASGYFSETTWQASTALTKGMDMFWALLLDDGLSTPTFGQGGSHESPMRVRVEIKALYDTLKMFPTKSCTKNADCMVLSYHYVRGELLGPGYPVDAGVAINQRYDVWTTVFYNGELPEEFTVLPS